MIRDQRAQMHKAQKVELGRLLEGGMSPVALKQVPLTAVGALQQG